MVSKSKPERQVRIKELLDYRQDSAWKNERKRLFLNAMDGVWKALLSTNVSPSDYLKGHGQGIDHSHYGTQFDKKVSADLVLAQDASFHARYINGYEFPDVPRFRQDADAWQEFVRSFCESVAVEAGKKGTRSLITKVIRAAVEPSNLLELKPDEIRDKLRVSWNGDKVGDGVWAKYTNGYFYPGRITGIVSKSDGRYFTIKYDDGDDGEVRSDGIRSAGYDITRYFEEDQPDA